LIAGRKPRANLTADWNGDVTDTFV